MGQHETSVLAKGLLQSSRTRQSFSHSISLVRKQSHFIIPAVPLCSVTILFIQPKCHVQLLHQLKYSHCDCQPPPIHSLAGSIRRTQTKLHSSAPHSTAGEGNPPVPGWSGLTARQPAVARCGLQAAPGRAANTAMECLSWQQDRFREEKTIDGHNETMSHLGRPLPKVVWAGTALRRCLVP